jgi:Ca-activated chloride channel family protein
MRRLLAVITLALVCAGTAKANGLLIPEEKKLPPLAMLSHLVKVTIDDQVAITTVEQVFRNHTDRPLEATYVFPVPRGASVRKFSMWVDGKEVPGELIDAATARKIYTDIVQRTLASWSTSATICCASRSSPCRPAAIKRSSSASPASPTATTA